MRAIGSGVAITLGLLLSGCQDDVAGAGGDAPPPPPKAVPIVSLVVDANRNGVLDLATTDDDAGRNAFDTKRGAVLLANLDDDNADAIADADTDPVDGDSDVADLSPLAIRAWPTAPDGTTATLTVDPKSEARVRIFRIVGAPDTAASYVPLDQTQPMTFTADDLRAGLALAAEARTIRLSPKPTEWNGIVHLSLDVHDAANAVLGSDRAQLRVAPVLFQFNTAPTEHVYYANAAGAADTLALGVAPVCTGIVDAKTIRQRRFDFDPWTQDFFDVGYASRPGPNGTVIGMKFAIRSAQPDRDAGLVVDNVFRGPDVASLFIHVPGGLDAQTHGYSMSSFGNWDVIPPYSKGDQHFPLGRNIWGQSDAASEQPDPDYVAFVRAQAVQPEVNVDTSWLAVGHVDEELSWVKTNTPRGWGMLAGSPRMAREMLEGLQGAGFGSTQLFVGKKVFDLESDSDREYNAARSIDQILANADLMASSQEAQVEIDAAVADLSDEIGLNPGEITEMPFLVEHVFGAGLAYQPGTVNLLHVDGRVAVPKPFGPTIDGHDPFESDIESRLGALGLEVHFVDDWDTYHREMGEVHCGTNVSRDLKLAWWESGR